MDEERIAPEHEAAAAIADEAGRLLLGIRAEMHAGGAEAAAVKAAGDMQSNDRILQRLAERFPGDAVLSEESADDRTRLQADRVWIIDPLDGTREFSEVGRRDWAVHVAFWQAGELRAGAVCLPALGVTLSTCSVPTPPAAHEGPLRLLVSRTRPPAMAQELAVRLGGELVPLGSAGAKAMAVVQGEGDVYAHGGGQYEWDSAAPVAVARHAGLHTSRLDGSALRYNRDDPWLPDLLICRNEHAEMVLDAIATSAE
jgi:3'(2'), 5'-bisphosphate nucleotidase